MPVPQTLSLKPRASIKRHVDDTSEHQVGERQHLRELTIEARIYHKEKQRGD